MPAADNIAAANGEHFSVLRRPASEDRRGPPGQVASVVTSASTMRTPRTNRLARLSPRDHW
jgi:hypothetical protein